MNYNELNEYIKHYVEKDQTKSAIMLTGGWGTGKSYYIRNVLEPFLKKEENSKMEENGKNEENGAHRCAVVSLYGLKDTSEISKRIYFELRTIGNTKKSEALSSTGVAAKIVAKTVLNGMTNMIGFDIGRISDKDLEKVYSSINLSNVLVVFEDLERSNIDIIDILGYVNSIVEQDGAKVLIVANEDDILIYHESEPDEDGKKYRAYDERSKMYLKAKEKTISDTIIFKSDIKNAIKNILSSFNNEFLNKFKSYDEINDILNIMSSQNNYNMRSFIFACQKTVDILDKINFKDDLENYIIKSIFYGTIYISMKIKNGLIPDFPLDNLLYKPNELKNCPVYCFCYKFIKWQQFSIDEVHSTILEHRTQRLYEKDKFEDDNDLRIIFYYYIFSENAVRAAFKNVERRLLTSNDIPIYSYDKLAYSLIKINAVLGMDYAICREIMIENIENNKNKIEPNVFDWSLPNYSFDSLEEESQFKNFSEVLFRALHSPSRLNKKYEFLYTLSDIEPLQKYVIENKEQILSNHKFLSEFDLNKLVEMILKCKPLNLDIFRSILKTVYEEAKKTDFLIADITFMEDLKNNLINSTPPNKIPLKKLDEILLLQINYLIKDLTRFIEQLS